MMLYGVFCSFLFRITFSGVRNIYLYLHQVFLLTDNQDMLEEFFSSLFNQINCGGFYFNFVWIFRKRLP